MDGFSRSTAPYPGLRSFRRAEYDIFFGRDDHVQDMIEKLTEHQFLCVTGPSGCGKSSLARTGLFNALEAGFLPGRGSDWIFCDLYPETDPLGRLCRSLATAILLGESGHGAPEPDAEQAERIEALANMFHNHVDTRSSDLTAAVESVSEVAGRPVIILVDQFEEIFRYAQDDPRAVSRFVDVLLKTAMVHSDIYVVITIRTDELEKCARYAGLTGAINQSQFLTPTLDRYQMQEAIEGPMSLFGGRVEPELSVWMLNGLEEQLDKLPLMQHALLLLYNHARKRAGEGGEVVLRLPDFYEVFGIKDAAGRRRSESHDALRMSLSHQLDRLYGALDEGGQRITRDLFCALTTLESRGRDIRRPIRLGEAAKTLGCSFDNLLRVLSHFKDGPESYLRVAGEDDGIDANDTVDVTHECILRLWRPLQRDWLPAEHASADNLRFLARLARERDQNRHGGWWDRLLGRGLIAGRTLSRYLAWWRERHPNPTWAGRHLARIEWTSDGHLLASGEIFTRVEAFVADSRRFDTIKVFLGAAAVVATLGLMGNVVYGQIETARARAEAAEAAQRTLELQETIREVERAQAAREAEVTRLEADIALREAERRYTEREKAALTISAVNITPLAEEPVVQAEGAITGLQQALTSGLPDGLVNLAVDKLLDALSYIQEWRRFSHGRGADAQVFAADFLPGGETFVTLDQAMRLRIWDAGGNGAPLRLLPLAPHLSHIDAARGRSLAVAPDGTIAAGTQRGGLLLVEGFGPETETEPRVTELYPGPPEWDRDTIMDLAFSRDGRLLIAAALTGHVHLWRRAPGGAWRHELSVTARNLTARQSGVGLVRADGREQDRRDFAVWSVALTPDARVAAMGLESGAVCLFRIDGRGARCDDSGHDQPVKAVRISPDGAELVSAGNDDRVRIWRFVPPPGLRPGGGPRDDMLTLRAELSDFVLWHDFDLWDLAFDASGDLLATATWDGSVHVFTTADWRPRKVLRGHELPLRSVAFGPDGDTLLTGSLDKTARIWTPFVSRRQDRSMSDALPRQVEPRRIVSVALGEGARWAALTNRHAIWLKTEDAPLERLYPLHGAETGFAFLTELAAPARGDLFVAARTDPSVMVWTRDPGGDWRPRQLRLTGEGARSSLRYRHLALSRDGQRFAVDVSDGRGTSAVLICAVAATSCGTDPGDHVALVPFVPVIEHGRDPSHDCNRAPDRSFISAIALSSDGTRLATGGSDCNVRLFTLDEATGGAEMTDVMTRHVGNISSVDISHDGDRILSGSLDWTGRLWTPGEEEVPQLAGHGSFVTEARFVPGGQVVATVSNDEQLILWDAETGGKVVELPGFLDSILSLDAAQTGTGAELVLGNGGGQLVAQPVFDTPQEVLDFARSRLDAVRGPLE
ncbi:NACHT and WD repeat domain-containing protein [Salipiger mucosus]|nr:AAA family ATPase [Salipiger mucosus]